MAIQLRSASSTRQRDFKNNAYHCCPAPSPWNFFQTSARF